MSRERWIKRGQARARKLRYAYRSARDRAGGPPPEPPVETDADPDAAEDEPLVAEAPTEPTATQGEGGASEQLALEGVGPAGPPLPHEPDDEEPEEEPGPPEVSVHQEKLPPAAPPANLGERIADVGHEARGALSDGRHWASERWTSIEPVTRHRVAAGIIVAAVALLVVLVLIPAAPCGFPGGDECQAPDDAIELVPADAVAYAHLDIDPESEQYAAAAELAGRVPLLERVALDPVAGLVGAEAELASDVRPWAGEEAALALIPVGPDAAAAALIEADDTDRARQFATAAMGPGARQEEAGGVPLTVAKGGRAAALVDGFLVIGDVGAVRAIADPPADAGELDSTEAGDAIDEVPDDSLAYIWLSGPGARALSSSPSLRPLNTFINSGASEGVTASLTVDGDVVRARVRSELDPERAEEQPGFFAALPSFEPTLASDVGPDALAYLGFGRPGTSIQSLLSQATTEAPELRRAYVDTAQRLRKRGGVNITSDLLPLLGTQIALSVEPVTASASETPGVAPAAGVPYVSLLAEGVDSEAAAADLATLQGPLAEALVPEGGEVAGRVATFESVQIAGTEAQSLPVSRNVDFTYATYDDRLAVSTDPLGIAQARAAGDGLADGEAFGRVTAGFSDEVSLIAYLNLRGLISLGEQIGLATDPLYAPLAPDLRQLEGAAVAVSADEDEIRTDASLSIGEPEVVEEEPSALPGD